MRTRQHRAKIDDRLRIIGNPQDPDHPSQLCAPITADLRDDLICNAVCIRRLRERTSLLGDDPRVRQLGPELVKELRTMLAQVEQSAERLAEKATRQVERGRPADLSRVLPILWLAECWEFATGSLPAQANTSGADVGPFAEWARDTLSRLTPDHPAAAEGTRKQKSRTPIRDALRWLSDEGYLQNAAPVPHAGYREE